MIIVRASKYGCVAYLRLNDGSEHEIPGFLAVRLPENKTEYCLEIGINPEFIKYVHHNDDAADITIDSNHVTYIKEYNNDKP